MVELLNNARGYLYESVFSILISGSDCLFFFFKFLSLLFSSVQFSYNSSLAPLFLLVFILWTMPGNSFQTIREQREPFRVGREFALYQGGNEGPHEDRSAQIIGSYNSDVVCCYYSLETFTNSQHLLENKPLRRNDPS